MYETSTTAEVYVGVVKAPVGAMYMYIHYKNPCQHASDLMMLEEAGLCFEKKRVDCIRVDGASDEGSEHEEVQFYRTERNIEKGKAATLVTAYNSRSSYLNSVELQNGCLSH